MNTTWHWSLDSEVNRILQTATNIGNHFYQHHHFPVLPWTQGVQYHSSAVYLPELNYHTIPRFFAKVARYNLSQLPVLDTYHFATPLRTKINRLNLSDPTNNTLRILWSQNANSITKVIYTLLPKMKNAIRYLHIYPTYFGTSASFNIPSLWPADLTIFLRVDQSLHSLVEVIVSALTRQDAVDHFGATWGESELLVDYLVTRTPLAAILHRLEPHTKFHSTTQLTRKKSNRQLTTQSRHFLEQIGAPNTNPSFKIDDEHLYYHNQPISNLTAREKKIFRLLISKSPSLVSYDEIADIIFDSYEHYSLYTISKVIERLRHKLESRGISSTYLMTARKEGYFLKI